MTSLTEQLDGEVVLAWDHEFGVVELSVLDLAFDPHELRVPSGMPHGGEWVHSPLAGDKPGKGIHRYVVPDPHRLDVPEPKKPRKNYFVHPQDHPFFRAHPVSPQNVLDYYDKADAGTREQGRAWYREIHNMAGSYIAPGHPEEGGILLSTYSPQTRWPINMMNAHRSAERGYGIGAGEGVMANNDQAEKANRAIAGEGIDKLMNTAKTHSFGALIAHGDDSPDDPYGHVVIDTHAVNIAAGGDIRGDKGGYGDAPIGNARYHEYVADQYRIAAQEISKREGRLMKPHELQAITWLVMVRETQAEDAWLAEHAPPKERGRAKGRIGGTKKDWRTWLAYAKEHKIPLKVGVSAPPAELLAAQIAYAEMTDLAAGSIAAQVLLAAWEHELRDPKGEWARTGGIGTQLLEREREYQQTRARREARHEYPVIGPEHARGNSRPVSAEEFQALARKGNSWLDKAKRDAAPITALDGNWDTIKHRAWGEVQKPWGGATIDAHTGEFMPDGADRYALTVKPRGMVPVHLPETISEADFKAAMDRAKEMFRPVLERQHFQLGVFHDDDLNQIDIDPVAVVDSPDLVEQVGAYTHATGGAYHFKTGNGYWPPHVPGGADMAAEASEIHFAGPGEWHRQAVEIQEPEPDDDEPDED